MSITIRRLRSSIVSSTHQSARVSPRQSVSSPHQLRDVHGSNFGANSTKFQSLGGVAVGNGDHLHIVFVRDSTRKSSAHLDPRARRSGPEVRDGYVNKKRPHDDGLIWLHPIVCLEHRRANVPMS